MMIGIVTAILFPIVGFVVGIVLLFKNRIGPALGCILLSVVAAVATYFVVQELTGDDAPPAATSSVASDASDTSVSSDDACKTAAREAVRISVDQAAAITLLKVRGLEVLKDNRSTVQPPTGTAEATVLVCKGVGVWSDGDSTTPVRIKVTVDSDSEVFIYYKAVE
jgi:hypothetical protein